MNSNGIRTIGLRIVFFSAAMLLFSLLSALPALARETHVESAAEDILTHEERIWLTNHPVIRLASERSYAPFIFQDENGKLHGISADYTALLEKKLGIKFQTMESKNLATILDAVHRGEIDMVTSLMKTPQRSEFLFFTTPYITVPVVIIVRRGFEGGSTLDSMGSFTIAVGKGYAVQSFLQEKHSGLSLVPAEDDVACLTKVSFGELDAAVVDIASASYIIDRLKITNLHVAGAVDFNYQLSFASRKDWPELNRILEKGIARISPDEHNEIYNKWVRLSQHTFFTARFIWTALAVIFAIILIGVTCAILWNRALKIKIHQKTEELREELAERRRMEAPLRTSEEKFRSLLKQGPVPMALLDGEGGISFLNDKHIQFFGYTTDRIGPQVLAFYRNLLNLRLLFKNQKKLRLSSVFKWLDISELNMPKLIDLCAQMVDIRLIFHLRRRIGLFLNSLSCRLSVIPVKS
jgi:ABC-type amino acid transport substrate-binding protein